MTLTVWRGRQSAAGCTACILFRTGSEDNFAKFTNNLTNTLVFALKQNCTFLHFFVSIPIRFDIVQIPFNQDFHGKSLTKNRL